jgi:hypothetical protein
MYSIRLITNQLQKNPFPGSKDPSSAIGNGKSKYYNNYRSIATVESTDRSIQTNIYIDNSIQFK